LAQLNLWRLKKAELVRMAQTRCKHRHTLLDHPQCYTPVPERVGFFDIETTAFDAGFGIMLSYAIKVGGEKTILTNCITKRDIDHAKAGDEDARIVAACIEDLKTFDRVVTHYGSDYRFDLPFIRTRAVSLNLDFPFYGSIKSDDTYSLLKRKFKLPRNRLETACRILLGTTEKNHIDPKIWRAAGRGNPKALSYVLDHNRRDVRDLEKIYEKIKNFVRATDTSI